MLCGHGEGVVVDYIDTVLTIHTDLTITTRTSTVIFVGISLTLLKEQSCKIKYLSVFTYSIKTNFYYLKIGGYLILKMWVRIVVNYTSKRACEFRTL